MELGKVQYFEKVETNKQREFMNAHNNCTLCGSALELQHVRVQEAGINNSEIKEEAHCPQCDVRTRAKVYALNQFLMLKTTEL